MLFKDGCEYGCEGEHDGDPLLFHKLHSPHSIESAHIDVQRPCMEAGRGHEKTAHMEEREQIQMYVLGRCPEEEVEMHVGPQDIAMTQECPPGLPPTAAV